MKNKHQQVVDLSNPNEGQYTSASTSAIKMNHNMSKQTSVEWLVNVVQSCIAPNFIPKEIVKQAKEMHRQELLDIWCDGNDYSSTQKEEFEAYYQETFGKKTN